MTSHPKIVVGIDGTPRGDDALAFATVLARTVHTGLLLAHAYGPGETLRDSRALLEPRCATVADLPVEVVSYSDSSPARGLARVAAARSAELIVVGPSHRAGVGLMLPGSTGQQLLHETPVAVAVVPRGWRAPGPLLHIGCGYDGSPRSDAALETASALTRLLGGELDVVRAFWSASLGGPVGIAVLADLEDRARGGAGGAAQALPADVQAHETPLLDDPARALITHSRDLDLLVLGSRGKGPLGAAVTGSVSNRVIREASCPVIVVTHGVPALFAPATDPAQAAAQA